MRLQEEVFESRFLNPVLLCTRYGQKFGDAWLSSVFCHCVLPFMLTVQIPVSHCKKNKNKNMTLMAKCNISIAMHNTSSSFCRTNHVCLPPHFFLLFCFFKTLQKQPPQPVATQQRLSRTKSHGKANYR